MFSVFLFVTNRITIMSTNEAFREHMWSSDSAFYEYYGTSQRVESREYEKAVVFTIPNNGTAMLEFLTTADGVEFVTGYWHIKNLIIEVREAWQEKNEPIETFKYAIKDQWIPLTDNFIQTWGTAMVPYDVRWAIADIRRNVGLPPLTWPPILLMKYDGTLVPTLYNERNDLGRVVAALQL